MKKQISRVLCAVMLLAVVLTAAGCSAGMGKDIIILFTNDVHCGIEDDIGYAGLAAYKQGLMEKNKFVTLVDCGDHVQGDYIGSVSKGEYIMQIMNAVGYDYSALGNHEFDFYPEQLAKNISLADMQYLCCNMEYSGKKMGALKETKPYEIVRYGSTKVAFIGVATPRTVVSTSPKKLQDNKGTYSFIGAGKAEEFYSCVQKYVDECRKKGADYVVVLAHLGTDDVDEPFRSIDLIANTTGVDVLLDGHSHSDIPCAVRKNKDGEEVLHAQTGTKLNNIGQLVITTSGFMTVSTVSDYENKDEKVDALIKSIQAEYEEKLADVVANSNVDMSINDENGVRMIRTREMGIGNFVADAYRIIGGADIGMCNAGGIRDSLSAGDVTYGDIIKVSPFGNTLCVVEVTGAEILDMLEAFYCDVESEYVRDGEAVGENGSFQQVSGLRFTVDTSIEPDIETDENEVLLAVGSRRRVSDVQVLQDGEYVPIDAQKTYTLASHNYFIKEGGSGMSVMMADHTLVLDESIPDYQVLIDYLDVLDGDLSQYAQPEGRITVK